MQHTAYQVTMMDKVHMLLCQYYQTASLYAKLNNYDACTYFNMFLPSNADDMKDFVNEVKGVFNKYATQKYFKRDRQDVFSAAFTFVHMTPENSEEVKK